jgi:hypothetical protein
MGRTDSILLGITAISAIVILAAFAVNSDDLPDRRAIELAMYAAADAEEYELAAKLRDEIRHIDRA